MLEMIYFLLVFGETYLHFDVKNEVPTKIFKGEKIEV